MSNQQPNLGTHRVTQNTPFFMIFSGPGFRSEPRGFESIEDCREAYSIVRADSHYRGAPVDYVKIVAQADDGDATVYHGRIV